MLRSKLIIKKLAKLFIRCGVDFWPTNCYKTTELPAMAFAAAKGDPSWIQLLIDEKIPINYGPQYCSPLCLSVTSHNSETFKFLCQNFNQDFNCPLHKNLMVSNVNFLKDTLTERNFSIPNAILYEIAQYSIEFNNYGDAIFFINILAKNGANRQEQEISNNIRSLPGQYLEDAALKTLMHFATKRRSKWILEKLIDLKFDINICDNIGRTSVSIATIYGHFDIVKFLVENHANINICDNSGNTPLHYAAKYKYMETFQFLIQHGADLGKRNNKEKTPLMLAKLQEKDEIIVEF